MEIKKQTYSKNRLLCSGLFLSFDEAIKNYFSVDRRWVELRGTHLFL